MTPTQQQALDRVDELIEESKGLGADTFVPERLIEALHELVGVVREMEQ